MSLFAMFLLLEGSANESNLTECQMDFTNGEAIVGGFESDEFLPKLTLHNGQYNDAIIKLENRETGSEHLYFIARGETAIIRSITPGKYTLEFAIKGRLARDCRTLTSALSIIRFSEEFDLYKREEAKPDGSIYTEVGSNWATLDSRDDGLAKSQTITLAEFNR